MSITVKDNGIGMNEDLLNKLNSKLERDNSDSILADIQENLGLLNVHFRIRDYYGQAFGLKIQSKENEGTMIRIILPIVRNIKQPKEE